MNQKIGIIGQIIQCVAEAVHKNNSVSGRPAGWLQKVRLETLFFIFAKKNVFFQKLTIFSWKKKIKWKKKKIAATRLASILATRCTGNRIFFYGQPEILTCCGVTSSGRRSRRNWFSDDLSQHGRPMYCTACRSRGLKSTEGE